MSAAAALQVELGSSHIMNCYATALSSDRQRVSVPGDVMTLPAGTTVLLVYFRRQDCPLSQIKTLDLF